MEGKSAGGQRVAGYDLIRVISCFFVIVVHFNAAVCGYDSGVFLFPNEIIPNFIVGGKIYLGTLGVVLFFFLSGAALMLSNPEGVHTPTFYRKRLLNLYPSFWIAFFVATCVDFLCDKGIPAANPLRMLAALSGMDGYLSQLGLISSPYYKLGEWFFGVIVLLYLLFPLVHWCLRRFPAVVCGVCAGMYALGLWAIGQNLPHSYNTSLLMCLPEMVLGMVYVRYDLRNRPRLSLAISLVALVAVAALHRFLMADFATLLLAVSIFTALMVCSRWMEGTRLARGLAWVAKLTYPLFLVHHWLIYKLVRGFDRANFPRQDVAMLFLIYLILGVALSMGLQWAGNRLAGLLRSSRPLLWLAVLATVASLLAALVGTVVQNVGNPGERTEILTSEAYDARVTAMDVQGDTIIVTFENRGTASWTEKGQFRCGLLNHGTDCGLRGYLEPEETIETGQCAVFVITLPERMETDSLQVVMLKEGAAYFGEPHEIEFEEDQP